MTLYGVHARGVLCQLYVSHPGILKIGCGASIQMKMTQRFTRLASCCTSFGRPSFLWWCALAPETVESKQSRYGVLSASSSAEIVIARACLGFGVHLELLGIEIIC